MSFSDAEGPDTMERHCQIWMEVSNISATIGDSIRALRRRIKLPQLLTILHGQMEDVVFHSMHASQYISGPTD